jgi:hypothetical protein
VDNTVDNIVDNTMDTISDHFRPAIPLEGSKLEPPGGIAGYGCRLEVNGKLEDFSVIGRDDPRVSAAPRE